MLFKNTKNIDFIAKNSFRSNLGDFWAYRKVCSRVYVLDTSEKDFYDLTIKISIFDFTAFVVRRLIFNFCDLAFEISTFENKSLRTSHLWYDIYDLTF